MAALNQAEKNEKNRRETGSLAPVEVKEVHRERSVTQPASARCSAPRLCSTLTIPSDTSAFDPVTWLSDLVAIGGGYALASGRKLWLVVDHCPADDLTAVMSRVVGHPERINAVRATIERRQIGEIA